MYWFLFVCFFGVGRLVKPRINFPHQNITVDEMITPRVLPLLAKTSARSDQPVKVGIITSTRNGQSAQSVDAALEVLRQRQAENWVRMEPLRLSADTGNSYESLRAACSLIEAGSAAVVFVRPAGTFPTVQSALAAIGFPLLVIEPSGIADRSRVDASPNSIPAADLPEKNSTCINLAPSFLGIQKAVLDVLTTEKMKNPVIFYSQLEDLAMLELLADNEDLRFHELLRIREGPDSANLTTQLSWHKEKLKIHRPLNVVLASCSSRSLGAQFLEGLLYGGLLEVSGKVLLPCLDMGTEDLVLYTQMNVRILLLHMEKRKPQLTLDSLLLIDALSALSNSVASLQILGKLSLQKTLNGCTGDEYWDQGGLVVDKIRSSSFLGETGTVHIDSEGSRSQFALKVSANNCAFETGDQVCEVGAWSTEQGYVRPQRVNRVREKSGRAGEKPKIIVTTILSAPYAMVKQSKEDEANWTAGVAYEGFVIDLLAEIKERLDIDYDLKISNAYGAHLENGTWTGMIGDLLEGRADMALADLTITSEREKVVEFSMPFLDLGVSILYVVSPKKTVDLFSFMLPLSSNVWIMILVSGAVVAFAMNLIARWTPFETGDLDNAEAPEQPSPFLSIRHCFWFSLCCWVQQGCEFQPRAVSTRTVASFWWFFTLIIISSYTANLAAYLTIEKIDSPIKSVEDLGLSNVIRYGGVKSGSTIDFFRNSSHHLYSLMWRRMREWGDDVLLDSNAEGVERVLSENGGFAFFMESTSIEYHVERHCRLAKIGDNLDRRLYGVAFPMGSVLETPVSSIIIKLIENGRIAELKEKWWKEERGGGMCRSDKQAAILSDNGGVSNLSLYNLGGIFLVLGIGIILGAIMASCEVLILKFKQRQLSI